MGLNAHGPFIIFEGFLYDRHVFILILMYMYVHVTETFILNYFNNRNNNKRAKYMVHNCK